MDTPEKDTAKAPEEGTQDVDWKDRYTNLQPAFTKATQELKELKQSLENISTENERYKQAVVELYNQKSQETQEDDDGIASKKDIHDEVRKLENQIKGFYAVREFEKTNPDLVEYENIVDLEVRKLSASDPILAKNPKAVLDKAAQNVRTFLETERKKAIELSKKSEAEKQKKEAEASGLETTITQEEPPEKIETPHDWANYRKQRFHQLSGNM